MTGVFAHGAGFGEIRPAVVFNGGDPTGRVTGIRWQSWGGPRAVGTGTGWYPAPDAVANGSYQPATVVAFDLGRCDGRLMYRAVTWYFPGRGGTFALHPYQDICKGSYAD